MYSLCRFLRPNPHVEPAIAVSPPRLVVTLTSMCCMWVSKFSCEFRMTSRTQHVLNRETLLVLKASSAEVL